jgi:hypothetical protein
MRLAWKAWILRCLPIAAGAQFNRGEIMGTNRLEDLARQKVIDEVKKGQALGQELADALGQAMCDLRPQLAKKHGVEKWQVNVMAAMAMLDNGCMAFVAGSGGEMEDAEGLMVRVRAVVDEWHTEYMRDTIGDERTERIHRRAEQTRKELEDGENQD